MRIFVLGPTGSGKSYLAKLIGDRFKLPVIEGSTWIRELTNCWDHTPEATAFLTKESIAQLAADPDISARALKEKDTGNCVFVGLRNPRDFAALYQEGDFMIWMAGEPVTEFEEHGLGIIAGLVPIDLFLTAHEYDPEDLFLAVSFEPPEQASCTE